MHLCSAALFIFLCCLALRGARSLKLQVQLTPDTARRVEGGDLLMNCTVDIVGAMSFTWEKDELEISPDAKMYLNRVRVGHQTIDKKQVSSLHITKLTECDSGTYYCKVNNMGTIVKTKGTNVIVTRASQTASCQPINIIFIGVSAGVGAALVIALIIVSLRLRRSIQDCLGLQKQFLTYIAEKSTDYMIMDEAKKHKPKRNAPSNFNQERKKNKKKSPQSNRVENMQRGNIQKP